VAFGFVEPGEGAVTGLPVDEGISARIGRVALRIVGRPGTPDRRRWWEGVSWRLASTAGLFCAALAVTGRVGLAAALALGDIALRPSFRALHARLWRPPNRDRLQDGAGI